MISLGKLERLDPWEKQFNGCYFFMKNILPEKLRPYSKVKAIPQWDNNYKPLAVSFEILGLNANYTYFFLNLGMYVSEEMVNLNYVENSKNYEGAFMTNNVKSVPMQLTRL